MTATPHKSPDLPWNNESIPAKKKPSANDNPPYSGGHKWLDPRLPWNEGES